MREGDKVDLRSEAARVLEGPKRPAMIAPLVALLSDFGLKDPYVSEMKAVILTICPEARIVDISHSIEKFNVRMGAFVLASVAPYFPAGTVHVAVVDPSVGTERRGLLVQTKRSFYIGPDNGLLMLAAQKDGITHTYAVTKPKFMLPTVSSTFHGRDVFAPAAAHLSKGILPKHFGPEISDCVMPRFAKPIRQAGRLVGEVLHIDDFGNIITNISEEDLNKARLKTGKTLAVDLKNECLKVCLRRTYGDAEANSVLMLIDSHGFLELAVNLGDASRRFRVKAGDAVSVSVA